MKVIEVGDRIKLKKSLKVGKKYGGLYLLDGMYTRLNRELSHEVLEVYDDERSYKSVTLIDNDPCGRSFYYTFEMLDFRTLDKTTNNICK